MTRPLLLAALVLLPDVALAADQGVTMSLDQFLQMYEAGKTRPDKPVNAPRPFTIDSAHYAGDVVFQDGEPTSVLFHARMHVEVLDQKDWAWVPVLPVTVALQSAKIAGKDAPIRIENGWYYVVTNQRGGLDLDLDFAVGVNTTEGASGFAFELASSGATDVSLAVPTTDDLDFKVANARLQKERVEGGKRIVDATLPAQGSLAVTWQREIPTEKKQTARVYSEVYTLIGIGDGVLHETATINDTILFSGVDDLKVKVPEGMTVLDVRGAGIRDWRLGGDNVLDVPLNYAAEGSYTLTVELERVVGETTQHLDAPIVQPVGVERSKGWVGVEARGNLEITGGEAKGATPVDVRTLPAAILGITDQPVLLGYKYLGTEVQIPLDVASHQDVDVLVTVVDQARGTTMFTRDGRRLTSVQYDVRNNRTQFLRLALPEGAELWSASVAGRAVQPAKGGDGRLLVPLIRSQNQGGALAAFTVEVVYVEKGTPPGTSGAGEFKAQLPTADVPSTYVGWTVYAPADAKVKKKSFDGSLHDVPYLTMPAGAPQMTAIQTYDEDVTKDARGEVANGGLGQGAAPVPVTLPLEGNPYSFEKLIALDEPLWVSFDYKGLEK